MLSENQNQYEWYRIRDLLQMWTFPKLWGLREKSLGGWVWKIYRSGKAEVLKEGSMWNRDRCEDQDKLKPMRTNKSSKDEAELSRMRTDTLTWKNEPACVFHHLQPHWCRRNLGNTSILCYGAGDAHACGLGLVELTGGDSVVAGISVGLAATPH